MSFTRGMYLVREDEEVLTVTVERSGDSGSHVMVLIATHPTEGTATGQCIVYVYYNNLCHDFLFSITCLTSYSVLFDQLHVYPPVLV